MKRPPRLAVTQLATTRGRQMTPEQARNALARMARDIAYAVQEPGVGHDELLMLRCALAARRLTVAAEEYATIYRDYPAQ